MNIILKSIASWKIAALIVIAVMGIWLIISFVISISYVRAVGKVVQLVQKGSGNDAYYCPVTVFQDKSGVQHTIESSSGSNPPRFPVGSTVLVLYRSGSPDNGFIDDPVLMWITPLVLIVLGICYGSIGFAVERLVQKKETRNTALPAHP